MSDEITRRIAEMSPQRRAALARLLEARAETPEPVPLRPQPRNGEPLPCSFGQQRLWFLDRIEPGTVAYVIVSALRMPRRVNAAALERALRELVRRHEVLRTTFREVDGEPVQIVAEEVHIPLRKVRGSEAVLQRLTAEESRQPFDLERGPLLRTSLVQVGRDRHVLLLAMHHIVTDGWSMKVLYQELDTLYEAFRTGKEPVLPPLPVQYADYAVWQRAWLTGDVLAKQVAYWRKQLAGVPRLELPADRPRPPLKSYRGASHGWRVPVAVTRALRELCRTEGVTPFMALLAAFAMLLSRYSGQTDIAVGSPIANRTRAEVEGLLGFFVNTLVLRTDLSGAPSFRTLLSRVRDAALGAYAHQDLPFERLVEELQPPRDLARNPLFDVMFQLQSSTNALSYASEGKSNSSMPAREASVFDLSLDMWENGDDLAAQFEYSTDLFDRDRIVRMAGHFITLLGAAVDDPDQPVTTLPLLTDDEQQEILADWNATSRRIPKAPLHALFEAQARRTPDAIAVRAGATTLTYEELNRRADLLAQELPATVIAVRLPRSPELIVALLAVLKAGGAYLPIDPAAPEARAASMMEDAGVEVVLDAAGRHDRGPSPATSHGPGKLAYIIYTSGSTGTPKGVEIGHRSLVNHALAIGRVFGLKPGDSVLQFASAAFDVAAEEIFPALLRGATVAIAREESLHSPEGLLAQIREEAITVLDIPTPLWQAWMAAFTEAPLPPSLRLLVVGSDQAAEGTLARWQQRAGRKRIRLLHGYGVTEATITSLLGEVDDRQTDLPIGYPIANTEVYVLDPHRQPVPVGVPGELYLGGAGLALGYRGRPELTAERFVTLPLGPPLIRPPATFSPPSGEKVNVAALEGNARRLYRTGDAVRWRDDGQLEFLGRLDDQIKLHGFRIEPAEIEAALLRHPSVTEARVVRRDDKGGDPRLVAYLVGPEATAADTLSQFLRGQLPEAMVPAAYVWLPALPLTRNGKLDRAALPAPGVARPRLQTTFAAPQDQLERAVATVWSEVLQVDHVGREDNFFDLGGRSLLLVRVHSQLRRVIGDRLSILDLFRYPTIRGLAACLRQREVSP